MTRSILAGLAIAAAVAVFSGMGCQSTGVGDPCTPEQEYDKSFLGFSYDEVNIESKSFQCQSRLCLVNHFQGRVSCPYGQQADGTPPAGANSCSSQGDWGCCTPGVGQHVDGIDAQGNPVNPTAQATVQPQCPDRSADKTVYCSCRCANADGNTNDGANYCTCPDGFTCTQLISPISDTEDKFLTGGYCVKSGTQFDPNVGACASHCDATLKKPDGTANCGPVP
jgi:hypothetical protein